MDWVTTGEYDVARIVLQRGVALTYLLAFVNVLDQFRPLLGEQGLMPVPRYLERVDFRRAPSLFQWHYSDSLAAAIGWTGVVLATAALSGGFDAVPVWAALVGWLVLWALYLSVVNVGQTFYGFGWESLLLEAGLCVAFLGNAQVATPIVTLFVLRWLLFRVEFGAGMIKMRGDACWRNLTCLDYHHETQPMPSPTSRTFHLLPTWFHRIETGSNHVAQLVAPWALFFPQPIAGIGAALIIVTQCYLMLSGNYAWLNFVTLILGFAAIPDSWFDAVGISVGTQPASATWFEWLALAFAVGVVILSWRPLLNLFSPDQRMNFSYNPYHVVNSYGAFGSITRHRREVVVEGSVDGETWQAYEFRGKPTDPDRRPGQFAPYHLRLDWLMWFLALSPRYGSAWFERFVDRLLEADPATLALLAHDPFDGRPPTMVRARIVDYRFATRSERRETGHRWVTGASRPMLGPLTGG
ncbi:MAG: lipase maturation factor family protein [Ilumatobacteraceae bacterium]|nr:lipase maturation factor family protein [Ilumatobacteraceae bacterium]